MRVGRIFSVTSLLSLCFLLITSCSSRGIGFGVILWPPENSSLESSDVVKIISESNIEESYIIEVPGSEEKESLKRWRVKSYESENAARQASSEYGPFAETMALSSSVGLPVRSQPDALSDRVYRLRQHEEIKVLSKAPEEAQVGEYRGYWYKVLTQDGTIGYCFDQYLLLYQEGEREAVLSVQSVDLRIEDFFTRSYYPERFVHLIRQGTPALQVLNPEHGLFPDREQGVITIVSAKYSLSEEFSDVESAGRNRYYFTDSGVYITMESPEPPVSSILVQFQAESSDITARFMSIPDLEEMIEEEKLRREVALQEIVEMGERFMSNAYGTIEIYPDGSFEWSGKERLVPETIKAEYEDTGTIRFDRYLSSDLRRKYDGAASFRFHGAGSDQGITFLYTLESQGIRLTMIPEDNVKDFMVREIGYNSLILFMNLQN
ncbi:SH3 domain-containing protein [Marispirochaeta sp.]|uniref:SH3 domain-containing protein n=1 Tax=Marispirochaeta sp. TaxID=2038653 RepID=UPI0029C89571|nr:SH3 domain-containing protein [Marispirochaeta sp.]